MRTYLLLRRLWKNRAHSFWYKWSYCEWLTGSQSPFSENSSQVLTSIGIVPTLESFLRSIARYNIIISQWMHSERIEGTSLDPLYILQLPVNKANLIISDQQANFRGGNIRLEEIGWGGEEGGAAKLPWKLAFRLALSTPTNRVLPVNKLQLGFQPYLHTYVAFLRFYSLNANLLFLVQRYILHSMPYTAHFIMMRRKYL